MFLFDCDESALAAEIKQAVVAAFNDLGLTRHDPTRWYDFLAELDPSHTPRCHFVGLDRIETGWNERLRMSYRLFLGRTPEASQFEEPPTSLSKLVARILTSDEFLQKRSCIRYLRGPAFNRIPKLIFLHVPRTGGTYFTGALRGAMPRRTASCYELGEPTWMLDAAFASIFSAHFSRSLYPDDAGHLFVASVRPPRERFCSRARYYGLSLTESSELPSYLLDEAVDGFQTRFVLGDHPATRWNSSDENLVLVPFDKIDLIVGSLFETGLCPLEPGMIFRNKSADFYTIELPQAVGTALDDNPDHQFFQAVSRTFSLTKTVEQLAMWLADGSGSAALSI